MQESTPIQPAQNSGQRRQVHSAGLVHLVLAVGGFAIGTTEFASMSLLPYFSRDLGIDAPTAGHVISAYALGVVVGAPVFAALGARFARRSQLIALMAIFAVANALSALAPNYHAMLVCRFVSGLPHGAYFGIASLVAASLVPAAQRTAAVGRLMLGLTVATIVGVPLANVLGQVIGWRWGFGIVAMIATLTAVLVNMFAPHDRPSGEASVLGEFAALARLQVWLTLAIGAIGFGGLFAVYTYLTSTLLQVTHAAALQIPLVLMVFGVGMTASNLIVPRFADRAIMPSAGVMLVWSAAMLALYPFAVHSIVTMALDVFGIGFGVSLATILQTRLMDVAGRAQGLAAALNHSAFNVANALGPWLGGIAIARGYGLPSTGFVGTGLALSGLVVWAIALSLTPKRRLTGGTAHEISRAADS
jgi:DHA1 family inner membrane transport protein